MAPRALLALGLALLLLRLSFNRPLLPPLCLLRLHLREGATNTLALFADLRRAISHLTLHVGARTQALKAAGRFRDLLAFLPLPLAQSACLRRNQLRIGLRKTPLFSTCPMFVSSLSW